MDGRTSCDDLWRTALDLNRAASAVDPRAARLPPLIFLTDPDRTPQPWRIAARLPAGAAVIHRGFGRPEAPEEARRLREATRTAGVRLLIAADAELAGAVGADGVHLPERDAGRAPALRRLRPDWLITAALHPPGDGPHGVDALLISPAFPAGGASASRPALGVRAFSDAVSAAKVPAYALGGVTARRARELTGSGACGIAAIDAVVRAFAD
ncbi:thiamine phosphate synthase [Brevundimonas sp.]|uniref:thiamine phosphate synthase n=1 Tax=Brevundimonas sp. TaxID=1871086 RepID=UPI002E1524F4|nr:thiamine phosphate synthase [Brevundimonas sp.]